jgi:hypothetical protein
VADPFETGNESSGPKKCGEFLDKLENQQVVKEDSAEYTLDS